MSNPILATAASVETARAFWGGGTGKWAAEALIRAMAQGLPLSTQALRTLETLRRDDWKAFDNALITGAASRLRIVADLIGAGLVKTIPNGMGKTVLEWETIGDMQPAIVSMDGMARSDNDAIEFGAGGIPLPITHKDFFINLRKLAASRNSGQPLDTLQAEVAGRKVAEKVEDMVINGGRDFLGLHIYGLTNHPSRNTRDFSTNPWSDNTTTGEDMLADINLGIQQLENDGFFGPYWLYVPSNFNIRLGEDFKDASDKPTRARLLETDRLDRITVLDGLPDDEMVLLQPTADVIQLVEGEPLQTVQWDVNGGFGINFKAFTIQVPLLRADPDGNMGILHYRTP